LASRAFQWAPSSAGVTRLESTYPEERSWDSLWTSAAHKPAKMAGVFGESPTSFALDNRRAPMYLPVESCESLRIALQSLGKPALAAELSWHLQATDISRLEKTVFLRRFRRVVEETEHAGSDVLNCCVRRGTGPDGAGKEVEPPKRPVLI
jgi:hypothetical protein